MSEEGQTLILKVTRKLGHISHIGYSTGKWEEPITATFLWNKIRNQRRKNVFTKFNKTEKKVFQELTKNVDRVHIADEQKEQKVLHILRKTSGRGDFLACCQLIQSLDRRASDDRRKLKQVWKSSAKQRQIVNIQECLSTFPVGYSQRMHSLWAKNSGDAKWNQVWDSEAKVS